ncbi:hypothetical protein [Vibrio sp. R78045]|uniref:hypothetical protein n=1 Tax=Vibrio sp. R78045 TaxID=3093868 RepID=UPI0036F1A948
MYTSTVAPDRIEALEKSRITFIPLQHCIKRINGKIQDSQDQPFIAAGDLRPIEMDQQMTQMFIDFYNNVIEKGNIKKYLLSEKAIEPIGFENDTIPFAYVSTRDFINVVDYRFQLDAVSPEMEDVRNTLRRWRLNFDVPVTLIALRT